MKRLHLVADRSDIHITTECGRTATKTEHGFVHPWHSAQYECMVEVYVTTSINKATCKRCINEAKRRIKADSANQLGQSSPDSSTNQ